MKIRFKLISKCNSKLAVVKLIKECTGLGLADSKDIVDDVFSSIGLFREIELIKPYIKDGVLFSPIEEFRKIHQYGEFQVSGGVSYERDYKMLCLGIGELEDYAKFILDYFLYNSNLEESKLVLQKTLSKLDKEHLIELVEQINNK